VDALTPAERRGAIVVVLLLALGAAHDLWRASRPLPAPSRDARASSALPAEGWERPGAVERTPGPDMIDVGGERSATPRSAMAAVDLNRATARELDELPGVGPVLAGRIIAHRERHGGFRHPEELLAVRGIGPRLFARLRARVTVGPASPVADPAGPKAAPGGR
jgi:competence protein ComEA